MLTNFDPVINHLHPKWNLPLPKTRELFYDAEGIGKLYVSGVFGTAILQSGWR